MMPPWRRRASFDVTHHSKKCLNRFGIDVGRKGLDFSRFCSQVVPIVNDAIGVGITELPRGVATDTRSPESIHLMSKVSRGGVNGWVFVAGSLYRIKFEGGPHIRAFE